jgi:hypothetical protein
VNTYPEKNVSLRWIQARVRKKYCTDKQYIGYNTIYCRLWILQYNMLSTWDIAIQYINVSILTNILFALFQKTNIYCSSLSDTTNILFAPMDTTNIFIPTEFQYQSRRNARRETFFDYSFRSICRYHYLILLFSVTVSSVIAFCPSL